MKGEVVRLILQTVSENPSNLYEALEEKGYPKAKAWYYVPCLKAWGYIQRKAKGQYVLTEKGKAKLNRLLYGVAQCPYCQSTNVRLNGKRTLKNGERKQRFLCNNCGFGWAEGRKFESLVAALKKKKRVIFILHTSERFAYPILQKLRDWLKSDELGYLAKNVDLIVP
jgi:transposase-like protein